ncbi:MAG: hypothetical protein JO013_06930 [Alphaproteobacteria bacterium]|nr:hypothetical protein [Alphaproteobacteria bacterium]
MRKLASFFLSLIAAFVLAAPAPASGGAGAVEQVFLIQNSGWMEPFYLDPKSPLRAFVGSLIGKANLQGVPVVVAAFNQEGQVPGRTSPEVMFDGPYDAGAIAAALARIDLPRKPSGAYADADFKGALTGTFSRIMRGREGVIWIVTNNKDAPDNRPTVVENTRAFYNALRQSPHITAIAAFPMRKVVTGPHFNEKGLIVYALAYGERGANALAAILRPGAPVRALFPAPPVKLKPLTTDPVELHLTSAAAGVTAEVVKGRLIVSGVPGGSPSVVRLQGTVRNTYYPQNIARAALTTGWHSADPALRSGQASMTPQVLENVKAAGESGPVQLELRLPAVPRSGGLAGLLEDERTAVGEVEVRLQDLRFSLDPAFVARISAISGGEMIRDEQAEAAMAAHLPEVFLDYRRISSATMKVPVQITFRYSPWPLILAIALAALALAAALFLLVMSARPREYTVRVGQGDQRIRIKPREKRTLADAYGTRAEVMGRMFGPPSVTPLND